MHSYTKIMPAIIQCNDCGAQADTKENVVHYATCVPGESEMWEKFYARSNTAMDELVTQIKRSQTAGHKELMRKGRREFHKK